MKERIIQIFNADLQPVFVGMETAKAVWTIPRKSFRYLTYMAHLSDGNACYYEDLRTQAVAWTLPLAELSSGAANAVTVLQKSSESETIDWTNDPYPEDDSIDTMLAIDDYLLEREHGAHAESSSEDEEEPKKEVSPHSPTVMSQIFSASSSQLFDKSAQKVASADESDEEGEDSLDDVDAKPVEDDDGADSGSESGSGGTASTDGDNGAGQQEDSVVDDGYLTAAQILRQSTIKAMKMTVLGKGTFRNWKERYVVLRSHHIAYYEDATNLAKPEVEFQLNPSVTVRPVEQKQGFGLKITTAQDTLSIALSTEDERDLWTDLIESTAAKAGDALRANAVLLSAEEEEALLQSLTMPPAPSSASPSPKKPAWGNKRNRRHFILAGSLLTVHPDENSTATIEAFYELGDDAVVQLCDEASRTIILSQDLSLNRTTTSAATHHLAIQFSLMVGSLYNMVSSQNADQQQYAAWKSRLMRLLPFAATPSAPQSPVPVSAPATPLRSAPSSQKLPVTVEASGSEHESESDNESHDSGFGHGHAHDVAEPFDVSADISAPSTPAAAAQPIDESASAAVPLSSGAASENGSIDDYETRTQQQDKVLVREASGHDLATDGDFSDSHSEDHSDSQSDEQSLDGAVVDPSGDTHPGDHSDHPDHGPSRRAAEQASLVADDSTEEVHHPDHGPSRRAAEQASLVADDSTEEVHHPDHGLSRRAAEQASLVADDSTEEVQPDESMEIASMVVTDTPLQGQSAGAADNEAGRAAKDIANLPARPVHMMVEVEESSEEEASSGGDELVVEECVHGDSEIRENSILEVEDAAPVESAATASNHNQGEEVAPSSDALAGQDLDVVSGHDDREVIDPSVVPEADALESEPAPRGQEEREISMLPSPSEIVAQEVEEAVSSPAEAKAPLQSVADEPELPTPAAPKPAEAEDLTDSHPMTSAVEKGAEQHRPEPSSDDISIAPPPVTEANAEPTKVGIDSGERVEETLLGSPSGPQATDTGSAAEPGPAEQPEPAVTISVTSGVAPTVASGDAAAAGDHSVDQLAPTPVSASVATVLDSAQGAQAHSDSTAEKKAPVPAAEVTKAAAKAPLVKSKLMQKALAKKNAAAEAEKARHSKANLPAAAAPTQQAPPLAPVPRRDEPPSNPVTQESVVSVQSATGTEGRSSGGPEQGKLLPNEVSTEPVAVVNRPGNPSPEPTVSLPSPPNSAVSASAQHPSAPPAPVPLPPVSLLPAASAEEQQNVAVARDSASVSGPAVEAPAPVQEEDEKLSSADWALPAPEIIQPPAPAVPAEPAASMDQPDIDAKEHVEPPPPALPAPPAQAPLPPLTPPAPLTASTKRRPSARVEQPLSGIQPATDVELETSKTDTGHSVPPAANSSEAQRRPSAPSLPADKPAPPPAVPPLAEGLRRPSVPGNLVSVSGPHVSVPKAAPLGSGVPPPPAVTAVELSVPPPQRRPSAPAPPAEPSKTALQPPASIPAPPAPTRTPTPPAERRPSSTVRAAQNPPVQAPGPPPPPAPPVPPAAATEVSRRPSTSHKAQPEPPAQPPLPPVERRPSAPATRPEPPSIPPAPVTTPAPPPEQPPEPLSVPLRPSVPPPIAPPSAPPVAPPVAPPIAPSVPSLAAAAPSAPAPPAGRRPSLPETKPAPPPVTERRPSAAPLPPLPAPQPPTAPVVFAASKPTPPEPALKHAEPPTAPPPPPGPVVVPVPAQRLSIPAVSPAPAAPPAPSVGAPVQPLRLTEVHEEAPLSSSTESFKKPGDGAHPMPALESQTKPAAPLAPSAPPVPPSAPPVSITRPEVPSVKPAPPNAARRPSTLKEDKPAPPASPVPPTAAPLPPGAPQSPSVAMHTPALSSERRPSAQQTTAGPVAKPPHPLPDPAADPERHPRAAPPQPPVPPTAAASSPMSIPVVPVPALVPVPAPVAPLKPVEDPISPEPPAPAPAPAAPASETAGLKPPVPISVPLPPALSTMPAPVAASNPVPPPPMPQEPETVANVAASVKAPLAPPVAAAAPPAPPALPLALEVEEPKIRAIAMPAELSTSPRGTDAGRSKEVPPPPSQPTEAKAAFIANLVNIPKSPTPAVSEAEDATDVIESASAAATTVPHGDNSPVSPPSVLQATPKPPDDAVDDRSPSAVLSSNGTHEELPRPPQPPMPSSVAAKIPAVPVPPPPPSQGRTASTVADVGQQEAVSLPPAELSAASPPPPPAPSAAPADNSMPVSIPLPPPPPAPASAQSGTGGPIAGLSVSAPPVTERPPARAPVPAPAPASQLIPASQPPQSPQPPQPLQPPQPPQPSIAAPEPSSYTAAMLRRPQPGVDVDLHINKADLLQNLYLETRRTPMGRVIFERYKTSDITIDPHGMQRLCYDFGVYVSPHEMEETLRRYASLAGGVMVYQDFTSWWTDNEAISAVKLNDPAFIRKSQAVACFKKFDPDLRGAIHAECFPHVHTMLVQLEIISAEATVAAVLARLDPERRQVVGLTDYLSWIIQEEQPENKRKTPLQKLFGEVARRSSSAIYTPSQAQKRVALAGTNSSASAADGVGAGDKARFNTRAAVVKKFIGGAAIAGVPRTLATAYTERGELAPITEGKFGKAFDLERINALANPPPEPTIEVEEEEEEEEEATVEEASSSSSEDESDEEGLEMWELKIKQEERAVRKAERAAARAAKAAAAAASPSARRRSSMAVSTETLTPVRAESLKPAKSALRSRSISPTSGRKAGTGNAVRFDERRYVEPPPAPIASPVRTRTASVSKNGPDFLFFDESALPKEDDPPVEHRQLSRGYHEAKASGVFLNKYCRDEDEGSDSEASEPGDDVRPLHNEGGELSRAFVNAIVEEMFAVRNYVSPLKPPPAARPPPPPPPPSTGELWAEVEQGAEAATERADDGEYADTGAAFDEDKTHSDGDQLAGGTLSDESKSDDNEDKQEEDDHQLQPANNVDAAEIPAPVEPSGPVGLKARIAALNLTSKTEPAKPNFSVGKAAVQSVSSEAPGPVAPPPSPPKPPLPPPSADKATPSKTAAVMRFASPSLPKAMIPLPAIDEYGATKATRTLLEDANSVISSAVSRMKTLAAARSLKIPAKAPLVSDLVHAHINREALRSDTQLSGYGKLDAFEQLMMERKAISEALVKLQDLEEATLTRIKEAEAASLQRIQNIGATNVEQVQRAEQRLGAKAELHVHTVRKQSTVLANMRRELHTRQVAAHKLEHQRFEEVAQVATALAEQQLHIAAERKRMAEKEFQLRLSLLDLEQVTNASSRPSSPGHRSAQGSVAGGPARSGSLHYNPYTAVHPYVSELAQGLHEVRHQQSPHYQAQPQRHQHLPSSQQHHRHQPQPLPQYQYRQQYSPPQELAQSASPPRPPSVSPPPDSPPGPPQYSSAHDAPPGTVDSPEKADSPPFDRLTPLWHTPVVPLGARRASVTRAVAHTGEVMHRVPGHLVQNTSRSTQGQGHGSAHGQVPNRRRSFR